MAGYSGTPLPKKLGIKEEHRVAVLGGPEGFEDLLEPLPDRVSLRTAARGTNIDETWSGLRVVWRRELRNAKR